MTRVKKFIKISNPKSSTKRILSLPSHRSSHTGVFQYQPFKKLVKRLGTTIYTKLPGGKKNLEFRVTKTAVEVIKAHVEEKMIENFKKAKMIAKAYKKKTITGKELGLVGFIQKQSC